MRMKILLQMNKANSNLSFRKIYSFSVILPVYFQQEIETFNFKTGAARFPDERLSL